MIWHRYRINGPIDKETMSTNHLLTYDSPSRMKTQLQIAQLIKEAIEKAIPEAHITVETGGFGHFSIQVVSSQFATKSKLASHRLVLSAIAPLMNGHEAYVHAIDSLETISPHVT